VYRRCTFLTAALFGAGGSPASALGSGFTGTAVALVSRGGPTRSGN